jgi:hypothetical protein
MFIIYINDFCEQEAQYSVPDIGSSCECWDSRPLRRPSVFGTLVRSTAVC